MATYLDTLGKFQQQSLDALKHVQATQLAALTTLGDLVSEMPAFKPGAAFENLPTFSELSELNASFARTILEQQNDYAAKLAGVLTATQKNVVEAADKVFQTATGAK